MRAFIRTFSLSLAAVLLAACGQPASLAPAPVSQRPVSAVPEPVRAAQSPLAVGASAPDFRLAASTGAEVRLADELEHGGPVLLIFYTHAGCSACTEALAQLQAEHPAFAAQGARLFALADQTAAAAAQTAQDLALDYAVLADSEAAVARQYGVRPLLPGRPKLFQSPVSIFVVWPSGKLAWGGPVPLDAELPVDGLLELVRR